MACCVALLWSSQARGERLLGIAGDLGLGGIGDQAVSTVQSGVDVREGSLQLGLFGRVRITLRDGGADGALRGRDWDEVSDYVHILRYLQYQRRFYSKATDTVDLRFQAGEILGYTLGHGSLIRDYSNIADPDHLHAGIALRLAGPRWQWATVLDNFVNPTVIGTRVALKPLASLDGLSVGASAVVDPQAPTRIRNRVGEPRAMDHSATLVSDTEPLTLLGLDVEYSVERAGLGRVAPYLDLNTSLLGLGLHAGALGELQLDRVGIKLVAQLEYRVGSGGYAPAHMETFYDVERYQAGLSFAKPSTATLNERAPKLAGLARGAYGGQGVLGQLGCKVGHKASFKLGASFRPGPDPIQLWWRGSARPLPRLQLAVMLLARGIGTSDEGGNGLATVAEGRFRITENLYTLAQYVRTWSLSADTRYYQALQSFNLSLGASWSG